MFEEYLDRIELAKRHASAIAYPGAFWFGAGLTLVFLLFTGGWGASIWIAGPLFVGCTFYGAVYGIVYVSALGEYNRIETVEVTQNTPSPPAQPVTVRDLPIGQPTRERRPTPDAQTEDADPVLPEYVLSVDKMIWGDRLNLNGHLIDMPDGFKAHWLYTVAEKRRADELETISLRALDDIGISRWGNGISPALQVIKILEDTECIQSKGANQPYVWTNSGNALFPAGSVS